MVESWLFRFPITRSMNYWSGHMKIEMGLVFIWGLINKKLASFFFLCIFHLMDLRVGLSCLLFSSDLLFQFDFVSMNIWSFCMFFHSWGNPFVWFSVCNQKATYFWGKTKRKNCLYVAFIGILWLCIYLGFDCMWKTHEFEDKSISN